ncbi:MAG TPA: GMC family oxidoreductase [Longimicrobium sp.]
MRDVVIIGSGAGGSALALRLSQAGCDVLVLEKGPRYTRADYRHDELLFADRPGFWTPALEDDPHVVMDHTAGAGQPTLSTLGWIARCVGGGTEHMGGTLYRFHPDDFRMKRRFGPYLEVEDWPYGYDEIEEYYSAAEWEVGISGTGGANPFEGHRSRPYPMPPVSTHPLAAWIDAAARRLGAHPFPTPRAVNSVPFGGRPACSDCDFCAGYGCPTGARGSGQSALLPRAEATGRCEVRPDVMVREVTVGPDGRATGCIYLDAHGVEHRESARVVCVCASAVESARLLLLSTSPLFPDGLANGSGRVGRHLQLHAGSAGRGRFRRELHPEKGLHHRGSFLGRSVMDYYFLPPGVSDFPKGGLLRFDMERVNPIVAAQRAAVGADGRLLWGRALEERLHEHFHEFREAEFEVFQEFLPNEATRVELDPAVRDRWGLAAARLNLYEPPHHRAAGAWVAQRGLDILEAAGADELVGRGTGFTVKVMAHGTCRAGTDPATSVLDGFCRAHEVANLFVVDGSFMPVAAGAPSTLTIVANAFRTADYIVDRARSGDLEPRRRARSAVAAAVPGSAR